MVKRIEYKKSFDQTVASLSIGGFYLEGYVENPKLENYEIRSRLVGRQNDTVGTINRKGLIFLIDEKDEEHILAALSFLDKPKNNSPGKKQKRIYSRQVHFKKEEFVDFDEEDLE